MVDYFEIWNFTFIIYIYENISFNQVVASRNIEALRTFIFGVVKFGKHNPMNNTPLYLTTEPEY